MATEAGNGGAAPGTGRRATGIRQPLAGPVGEGLRQGRLAAGISLRALAREIGVSPSLISQIEHGKATPSVATLYAIVSVLDLSLDDLFFPGAGAGTDGGRDRHPLPPRRARGGPVLRDEDRLSLTLATGVRWERLTATHDDGVEFLYCTYPVGGESTSASDLVAHNGSEYGLVIAGRCGATVGGETYELGAGDSIAFDSSKPHRIWNLSDAEPMIAVWTVVGRAGDPRLADQAERSTKAP